MHVEGVAFCRGDARCILAAVLQHHEAVVQQLVDRVLATTPIIPHIFVVSYQIAT